MEHASEMTAPREEAEPTVTDTVADPVNRNTPLLIGLAAVLGVLSFVVVLLFHNIADGDLWAKLALGAAVWKDGNVPVHDVFAFTPVLPVYVDHEWGAGAVFFSVLKWFGPNALLILKVILAVMTLGLALQVGRRFERSWPTLLLLAIPAAFCILPGFVPVIRSHVFTYVCFGAALLLLEKIRAGERWPAIALVALLFAWTNLHGGFVAGLGTIAVYAAASVFQRTNAKVMLAGTAGALAITIVNPYGPKYWAYVIPAILHKRPDIVEWQPMPLWGADPFMGFRILFVIVVVAVILGHRAAPRSLPGLCMLVITAVLAVRSRRHAPFFGVAALAFAGPFVHAAARVLAEKFSITTPRASALAARATFGCFVALTCYVAMNLLPGASLQVIAPVSQFPVREADILSRAGAEGNLAVPFSWGSYASWRLFPRIKVSIDGRYEAAYPESTYQMSRDFFAKKGADWDRLLKNHRVDFVAIDFQLCQLKPEDLADKGFVTVWRQDGVSALLARREQATLLLDTARALPPETIQPLDPSIPAAWAWR